MLRCVNICVLVMCVNTRDSYVKMAHSVASIIMDTTKPAEKKLPHILSSSIQRTKRRNSSVMYMTHEQSAAREWKEKSGKTTKCTSKSMWQFEKVVISMTLHIRWMCDKRNNKLNSRQQHGMILSHIQIFNLTETEIETRSTRKNAKYLHRFRCHSQLAIDRSINDVSWYFHRWKMFVIVSLKKKESTIFGALRVYNRQTIDNLNFINVRLIENPNWINVPTWLKHNKFDSFRRHFWLAMKHAATFQGAIHSKLIFKL